jgi:hypothetical protein
MPGSDSSAHSAQETAQSITTGKPSILFPSGLFCSHAKSEACPGTVVAVFNTCLFQAYTVPTCLFQAYTVPTRGVGHSQHDCMLFPNRLFCSHTRCEAFPGTVVDVPKSHILFPYEIQVIPSKSVCCSQAAYSIPTRGAWCSHHAPILFPHAS